MTSVQYKSNIILLQGGELMDERNNDFDFDFMPIGQAIKKAREARGMTSLNFHLRHNDNNAPIRYVPNGTRYLFHHLI